MDTNKNTTTETDSLELAKDAINYTLGRIRGDANIRYHMGAFTEAFERLKKAHSAINGISEEAIEQHVFSLQLDRKADAELVGEILNIIEGTQHEPASETLTRIKALLTR